MCNIIADNTLNVNSGFSAMIKLKRSDNYMLFPRIRSLREDKDITQKQLSEILSCSQRVYSNYERGELDIPTDILIKLANYHNVSIDFLLSQTDNPKRNK